MELLGRMFVYRLLHGNSVNGPIYLESVLKRPATLSRFHKQIPIKEDRYFKFS